MLAFVVDKSPDAGKDKVEKVAHVQLCRESEKTVFRQMPDWDARGAENVGIQLRMLVQRFVMELADEKAAAVAAVAD